MEQSLTEKKEMMRENVRQIALIDFDRTLCDTAAAIGFFYDAVALSGMDELAENMRGTQIDMESTGESYEPLKKLREEAGEDGFEMVGQNFLKLARGRLMYKDAKKLLEKMDKHRVPYKVLTYGQSESWQKWKIEASGYDGDYRIIGTKDKGRIISEYLHRGVFEIDIDDVKYVSRNTAMVDDRLRAFDSLPAGCSGFWLQRDEYTDGKRTLPEGVRMIRSLDQLHVTEGKLNIV